MELTCTNMLILAILINNPEFSANVYVTNDADNYQHNYPFVLDCPQIEIYNLKF